jgi:hypothetical protein
VLRNLADVWGWIERLIRRIDRLESGANLENSSITNGRMRFIGGLLRIDSGGRVEIVGTLEIDGTTTVTGTFTVEGPWSLDGNGSITGNVTVTGKITVGSMVIDPASGGSISFPGGARLDADPGGGIRLIQGTTRVYVGTNSVLMQMGGRSIQISASGVTFSGLPTIQSSLAGGAAPGSAWFDPSNQLYRVVTG